MQETVNFYGTELIVVHSENMRLVAVKPICDAIGVDHNRQVSKIQNDQSFSYRHMSATGSDGKYYEMICLPLDQINGWLFSINVNKVKPECKNKLVLYKKECHMALFNHFMCRQGVSDLTAQIEQLKQEQLVYINIIAQKEKELEWFRTNQTFQTELINKLMNELSYLKQEFNTFKTNTERVLGPFLDSYASAAGTMLEAHKKTKGFRN